MGAYSEPHHLTAKKGGPQAPKHRTQKPGGN